MKERGIVKVHLRGRDIPLTIPLKLAMVIESETGEGIVRLVRLGVSGGLPLASIIKILKAALSQNGENWDDDELLLAVEECGVMTAMLYAAQILDVFFATPKTPLAKKAKASDSVGRATH